jgi:ureidoglycolate lyase
MSVVRRELRLVAFDERALEPYARVVQPPQEPAQRQQYTEWLAEPPPGSQLRLHTNKIVRSTLPLHVERFERHPRSAQIFIPLDVARYIVIVVPEDDAGCPQVHAATGMIVPGDRGIVLRKGAWHAAATVLDRTGSFFVLQYIIDSPADDEFRTLVEPLVVTD